MLRGLALFDDLHKPGIMPEQVPIRLLQGLAMREVGEDLGGLIEKGDPSFLVENDHPVFEGAQDIFP